MSRSRRINDTIKQASRRALSSTARVSTSIVKWASDRVLPIIIALTLSGAGVGVYANLNSPAPPTDPVAQSYSIQDICDRLETGAEGSLSSSFVEPPASPAATPSMCSTNDVYELTPQPDEANAAASNQVEAGKTFWALSPSGEWGLTTGTGIAAEGIAGLLAATGQDTCYNASGDTISCTDTGQDGEYQLGATESPRFTDNEDGTVTDNLTGLIWLQNANCFGTRTWQNALNDANGLASGSCGLSDGSAAGDWRLPNRRELLSLVDFQNSNPSLPSGHPFSSVVSGCYWSSTTRVNNPTSAGRVFFGASSANFATKALDFYVWPVR